MNIIHNSSARDEGLYILRRTFDTHPQIWNDTNNREMLLNVLIRIGTTLLLVDNPQSSRCKYGALSCLTLVIISLEKYGETENIDLANLDQYAATKRVLLNPKGVIF